jgi:PLP dependent protein
MAIADRYHEILDAMAHHCAVAGRPLDSVQLIAVSKTQTVEAIQALYDLGHRHFGESRQQELAVKVPQLPDDIVWHFIGTLQSNKVRKVAEQCSVIHTLHSQSQLKEIRKLTEPIEVLIEVNIGEEEQKSGIYSKSLDELIESVLECDQANLTGLMTIGPATEEAEQMRPYFAKMRGLAEKYGLKCLSMGMSNDFGVAIQEGATHIRVGTSLFGERSR